MKCSILSLPALAQEGRHTLSILYPCARFVDHLFCLYFCTWWGKSFFLRGRFMSDHRKLLPWSGVLTDHVPGQKHRSIFFCNQHLLINLASLCQPIAIGSLVLHTTEELYRSGVGPRYRSEPTTQANQCNNRDNKK